MKRIVRMVGLLCLVFAAGGVPAVAGPEPPTHDARLNTTVSLELFRVPLSDLCWVMEKRSGIPHRTDDPATGDLLACVVGTLTVGQLQQSLADVLGIAWKRIGSGEESHYVAKRVPARAAEETHEQVEMERSFREGLRQLLAAASLRDEDFEKLPRSLRTQLGPGNREALQLLGALSPEEQSRILAGGGVIRAVASLPPAAQARVQAMLGSLRQRAMESINQVASGNGPGAAKVSLDARPLDLQNLAGWRVRIAPEARQVVAGQVNYFVWVYSPEEPGNGMGIGIGVNIGPPDRRDPSTYHLVSYGPAPQGPLSDAPLPDGFCPTGTRWEEVMRDLERALKRPIVSDAYFPVTFTEALAPPARREESLEAYLDRACRDAWNRRWGRVDPVLTFQRVDWALQRRAQIPESQARRWKQHILETGRLRVEDLQEMAFLTPYQLTNLGSIMGRQIDDLVTQYQELLLLWKAMPETHRRQARASGITIRDLPLALQPQARSLVSAALGSAAPLVLANATVRVEQSQEALMVSVLSPGQPAVARRLDLKCPSEWVQSLRKDEQARVAALEAAASSPVGAGTRR
jgi:hypothetical protein